MTVSPTTAQQRQIGEIQKRNLMKSPELVARGLFEFALKFAEVYGYGIVTGIAAGRAPAELTAASLQKLVRRRRAHDFVQVEITKEELQRVCEDLGSGLLCEMPAPRRDGIKEEDFTAVVAAWRKYSPHYVEDDIRSGKRLAAWAAALRPTSSFVRDAIGSDDRRDIALNTRLMHDNTADLLERLSRTVGGAS